VAQCDTLRPVGARYIIGVLSARQGKGIRAIARESGVARNTIRPILAGESDGRYGRRQPRPTKIDAHKGHVQERIDVSASARRFAGLRAQAIATVGTVG
jgi:transposase